VEYRGCSFALIFMAEYGIILFFRILTALLFFSFNLTTIITFFYSGIIAFFWVWLRASFPRYRYDKLIRFGWKIILPIILALVIYYAIFTF
jgi:NADH-quinone oxidoreductase subunit H